MARGKWRRRRARAVSLSPFRSCQLLDRSDGGMQLRFPRTGHGLAHFAIWILLMVIVVGGLTVPVVLGSIFGKASFFEMLAAGSFMIPYAALFGLAMVRHPTAHRGARLVLHPDGKALEVGSQSFTRDQLVGPMLFPSHFAGSTYYSLELLFRERAPLRLAQDRATAPLAEAAEAIAAWLGRETAPASVAGAANDPVLAATLPQAPPTQVSLAELPPDHDEDLGSQPLLEFYELRSITGRGRVRRTRSCLELTSKGPLAPVILSLVGLLLILALPAIRFLTSGRLDVPCAVIPIVLAVSLSARLWTFLRDFELRVFPDGRARLQTRALGLQALFKTRELGKVVFRVTTLGENKGLALMAHSAVSKPIQVWRSTTSSDLQRICLSLQALLGSKIEGSLAVQTAQLPDGPVFYQDRVCELRWSCERAVAGEPAEISLESRIRYRPLILDALGLQLLASPLYIGGLAPLFMRTGLGVPMLCLLLALLVAFWMWRWLPLARPWRLRIDADGPQLTRGSETGKLLDVDIQLAVEPLTLWPRLKKGSRLMLRSAGRRYLIAGAAHAGFLCALENALRARLEGPAEDWLPSGPSEDVSGPPPEAGQAASQAGPGQV